MDGIQLVRAGVNGELEGPPPEEMRYLEVSAEPGEKHTYSILTVNSAGVPSEPSTQAAIIKRQFLRLTCMRCSPRCEHGESESHLIASIIHTVSHLALNI